jgi:rhodanese-related sulfurtransferase
MDTIELDELRELLASDAQVRVVMTLGLYRYGQAHIPGSETFPTVDAALDALDPNEDIILYCAGSPHPASTWAHRILTSRGFRSVRVFSGGLAEWRAAGLPLGDGTESIEEVVA